MGPGGTSALSTTAMRSLGLLSFSAASGDDVCSRTLSFQARSPPTPSTSACTKHRSHSHHSSARASHDLGGWALMPDQRCGTSVRRVGARHPALRLHLRRRRRATALRDPFPHWNRACCSVHLRKCYLFNQSQSANSIVSNHGLRQKRSSWFPPSSFLYRKFLFEPKHILEEESGVNTKREREREKKKTREMAAAAKFRDLSDAFSRSECYCLNENPSYPFGNLFIGDATLQLKSDADGTCGATRTTAFAVAARLLWLLACCVTNERITCHVVASVAAAV